MRNFISRLLVVLAFGWAGSVSAIPITGTDIVTVDGTDWAQTDLFAGVTWSQIDTACPAGTCTGILNGYSVSGWTFASVDDVNTLFNHFFGYEHMGPGPSVRIGDSVDHQMIDDGFRGADGGGYIAGQSYQANYVEGFTRDLDPNGLPYYGSWSVQTSPESYGSASALTYRTEPIWSANGAWLYRSTASEVPTPATIPLLGIALAGLALTRNKRKEITIT